ncbi:MAG: ATP-binding protein [Acidobacteriota bacterium]|nr:ATP-binding protein [Acidobacteriota bacterium]
MSLAARYCGILLAASGLLTAERLPIRVFTADDGLPSNQITKILRDSHGFLWFGTRQGLARFDGYNFTSHGAAEILRDSYISDMLESSAGDLWIGTGTGLFRLRPASGKSAQKVDGVKPVSSLALGRDGTLWVATEAGLTRLPANADASIPEAVDLPVPAPAIFAVLADHLGALWLGTDRGLLRRFPNGRFEDYSKDGVARGVGTLLEDRAGRIWAGTENGLFRLSRASAGGRCVTELMYRDPARSRTWVQTLYQDARGQILASMQPRVGEFSPDARAGEPPNWRYTNVNGVVDTNHQAIVEDVAGNLWIGCESRGAIRIAHGGFVSFDRPDGLAGTRIASLFEDRAGELLALTGEPPMLNRWNGSRFTASGIRLPPGVAIGWGRNQVVHQDRQGDWWVPTQRGLLRFAPMPVPDLAHAQPKAVYGKRDGLSVTDVLHVYEDQRGDIWIASIDYHLRRWDRATGRIIDYGNTPGLPADRGTPTAFAEDHQGSLWIGSLGWLRRHRNGKFDVLSLETKTEYNYVRDLHVDRKGRVWIACRRGLLRIDDPAAEQIKVRAFTTADGLSSDDALCITEDRSGHIYAGTSRGADRLDPVTFPGPGSVRHFSSADGLPPGQLTVAFCDLHGTLWFGSLSGLSALVPEADAPRPPPAVWVSGMRVRNTAIPISALGQTRVDRLVLEPWQNQVQMDFSALSFWPGESLSFQYKLEGIDPDWSVPTTQRSLNYTNLAPGRYSLRVRATGADGSTSPQPAEVEFTVLRPVWQRWWFVTGVILAIAALVFILHRYLLAQALALERMRTHIARDLHDEIGSSLSQIAILSEVAQQHERPSQTVPQIASIARELVDAMNDIVWAINPKHDRLGNLLHRMQRFGEETLGACNIVLRFRAPDADASLRTRPEVRRHLFLVFKEAVTNAARHSGASAADIDLELDGKWFRLRIADDGCGFDPNEETEGDGLANMRKRVESLGGRFDLQSSPGQGTCLSVAIALVPHRNSAMASQS